MELWPSSDNFKTCLGNMSAISYSALQVLSFYAKNAWIWRKFWRIYVT